MKKYFVFVAVATLALLSCQKEELNSIVNDEVKKSEPLTFTASVEGFGTRADMTDSYGLKWTAGDKIGVYFPDWGEKNQSFTLVGDGGSSQGEFSRDQTGDYSQSDASSAYFPRVVSNGNDLESIEYNYVQDNGEVKFNLLEGYYNYTSGQMLTPLVASLSGSKSTANFYHAGAAVKVTINNLPKGAKSIGMTVDGKQITGNFYINPANAGSAYITAGDGNTNNSVWLNFTNDSESAWTFIFPVPTLATPTLTFNIYDENDVLVWTKTPKAQSSIGRAEVLSMPALSIEYYNQFSSNSNEWGVCGSYSSWNDDTEMITDGKLCIAKGVNLSSNAELKVRKNKKWDESYGSNKLNATKSNNAEGVDGGNIKVTAEGKYDIIFNSSDSKFGDYESHEIRVVTSNCPYPTIQQLVEQAP